jgi:hypothetical protein
MSAPVAGFPPVSAETPAPAPAPSNPPVTARVPVVSPHPINPNIVPNNTVKVSVRIMFLQFHAQRSMHNTRSWFRVSPNEVEKAAIARQIDHATVKHALVNRTRQV